MAKAGILFCIVCAVAAFGSGLPGGGVVGDGAGAVIRVAQREIGVRETGPNAGKRVDGYNRYVGVRNAPWCASFVSWCFGQAGYREPRTAWSPALFPEARVVRAPDARSGQVLLFRHGSRDLSSLRFPRDDVRKARNDGMGSRNEGKGLVFGIYFPELKRIGHCGFVEVIRGEWVQTIEGNTSPDGGREGVGVFRRLRHKRTICKYADWLRY